MLAGLRRVLGPSPVSIPCSGTDFLCDLGQLTLSLFASVPQPYNGGNSPALAHGDVLRLSTSKIVDTPAMGVYKMGNFTWA